MELASPDSRNTGFHSSRRKMYMLGPSAPDNSIATGWKRYVARISHTSSPLHGQPHSQLQ